MQYDVICCADERILRQFMKLLEEAFPPHERRSRGGQLALFDNPLYQIRAVVRDGRLLGFMAVWMLEDMVFLEHFAVDAAVRSRGIGGRMLDALIEEAKSMGRRLILEAELPVDALTKRRIAFYMRHGMKVNAYLYYQMPLRQGDAPTKMHLLSSSALSQNEFCTARNEIYRHVYGIRENQEDISMEAGQE